MRLTLYRENTGADSTIGSLWIGEGLTAYHFCYVCEDEKRVEKIAGETRIPSGTYEIKLRIGSPMANRYDSRHHDINHNGMFEIKDIPNFTNVMIHIGNNDDDTAGCLLVGYSSTIDTRNGGGTIGRSTQAYKDLYPKIKKSLDKGEKVFITIKDEGVR